MRTLFFTMFFAVGCISSMAQIVLPEGTRVRVRLEQTLSSATAEEGQPVNLSSTEDVKVGDTVVIPQGATCVGTIVHAIPKRRMGRSGKLDFSIDRVVTVDGASVPLRYSPTKKEGGSNAVKTGVLTGAAAIVFWPAAPAFLLIKGKDVTVNKGITVDVFTDQRFVLQPKAPVMPPAGISTLLPAGPQGSPATGPGAATASPGLGMPAVMPSMVTVSSSVDGADIELDGVFIGSTPTTVQMMPGAHNLTVKRGSAVWSRTLQIQPGGNVTVKAALSPVTSRN